MSGFSTIDGDANDELLFYFAKRVAIPEIYLKCSFVTDEGVNNISKIQLFKNLSLRDNKKVAKASIPYFNQMQILERLNITLTKITLSDLCENLNHQSLKEVFLSSEEDEKTSKKRLYPKRRNAPLQYLSGCLL